MERRSYYFQGRVQGVGFRYTVRNLAMQYDVSGYVRNLPNGTVELVMEGPEDEMSHLLDDVNRKMGAFIRDVKIAAAPATGEFQQFAIRH